MDVKAGSKLVAQAGISDYSRKLDPKGPGVVEVGATITVTKENQETAQRLADLGVLGPEAKEPAPAPAE